MSEPDLPLAAGSPDAPDAPELDQHLRALFSRSEAPAAVDSHFVSRVVVSMQRLRRRRLAIRVAIAMAAVAALGMSCAMTPALRELQEAISSLPLAATGSMAPFGAWLISPPGWALSLLLGTAVLWRTKVLRR